MATKTPLPPYLLTSCAGSVVLQGFPGKIDAQETGEHWLSRTIKQATANLDSKHLLQSVMRTSAYYVDEAKLWHLYTNPSHLPTPTLYRHAANLLLKDAPSLSPAPVLSSSLGSRPGILTGLNGGGLNGGSLNGGGSSSQVPQTPAE